MNKSAILEISLNGIWEPAMEIQVEGDPTTGHERTPTCFNYLLDYSFDHLDCRGAEAVSLRYPVGLADHRLDTWPAFLLDLLPTGAGRQRLCARLGLPFGAAADWDLLLRCGGAPPGNLRLSVSETRPTVATDGFSREDVVTRAESFVEYCIEYGYPAGGSSAVQGESPKLLLSEDVDGKFHPSGVIADEMVKQEWLVKFPRGRTEIDREILRAEATYYELASQVGLRVAGPLIWEQDCLFVPRFDVRPQKNRLHRYGLESMASALGRTAFGLSVSLDEFAGAIRRYSSDVTADLVELLRRDVLNVALGNTDNHSRNTALLKTGSCIGLAPLYDFAPMVVDPEWIRRACRWDNGEEAGYPRWQMIARELAIAEDEYKALCAELLRLATIIPTLPDRLQEEQLDKRIVERCRERCERVTRDLTHETNRR